MLAAAGTFSRICRMAYGNSYREGAMQPADSTPIAAAATRCSGTTDSLTSAATAIYAVLQHTEWVTDVNSGGVDGRPWMCWPVAVADTNGRPTAVSPLGISRAATGHLHELEPNTGSFDNDRRRLSRLHRRQQLCARRIHVFRGSPPVLNWPETNADLTEHTGAPPAAEAAASPPTTGNRSSPSTSSMSARTATYGSSTSCRTRTPAMASRCGSPTTCPDGRDIWAHWRRKRTARSPRRCSSASR